MGKITKDFAEMEFTRFCEAMDIDNTPDNMTEEDYQSFLGQKSKVVRAIMRGSLFVNDDGEPVYTTQRDKEPRKLTFYEPEGKNLMVMDKKKRDEDVTKMFATLGSMTKTSASTFASMKMSDLKVCLAVGVLFLG
jgi:hypothetical protein